MNIKQAYYAAGLIEGEGWFEAGTSLAVNIKMTDKDVLDNLCIMLGYGKVRGSYCPSPDKRKIIQFQKPYYQYVVYGDKAYALMVGIYPLLGKRRQLQIRNKVFDRYHKNPPEKYIFFNIETKEKVTIVRSKMARFCRQKKSFSKMYVSC